MLAVYYAALLVWLGTTAMHIPDGYLSPITCFDHVPAGTPILGDRYS